MSMNEVLNMSWQNLNALFEENYWINEEQRKAYKTDKPDEKDTSFKALANIPGVRVEHM